MQRTSATVLNVQALRAFAALIVVLFHVSRTVARDDPGGFIWYAGAFGVDLFFAISGFIIVHVSDRWLGRPWLFLKGRVVRIIPIYWIATLVVVVPVLLLHRPIGGIAAVDGGEILRNLWLIPNTAPGDGRYFYVTGAWTLVYEMLFYLLFAVGILLRSKLKALMFVVGAFFVLSALRVLVPHAQNTYFDYITDPVVYTFAGGALLGLLYPHMARVPLRRARWGGMALIAAGLTAWLLLAVNPDVLGDQRAIIYGIPAIGIVAGALLLEQAGLRATHPAVQAQGDASYCLYLFHEFGFGMVFWVARDLGLVEAFGLPIALFSVVAALVAAKFMHRWVERPLTTALSQRFVAPRLPVLAAAGQ
jgi:exopolysaccharide production protein ExoZ